MVIKREELLIGHTHPLALHLRSSAGDLSWPTFSENQGGVAYRRIFFSAVTTVTKKIARSEQLRNRYVTFVQEGLCVMDSYFEQFNEQTVSACL